MIVSNGAKVVRSNLSQGCQCPLLFCNIIPFQVSNRPVKTKVGHLIVAMSFQVRVSLWVKFNTSRQQFETSCLADWEVEAMLLLDTLMVVVLVQHINTLTHNVMECFLMESCKIIRSFPAIFQYTNACLNISPFQTLFMKLQLVSLTI